MPLSIANLIVLELVSVLKRQIKSTEFSFIENNIIKPTKK